MVWAIVRMLTAPHFKLGVATGAGVAVASFLWTVVPFLLRGMAYVGITLFYWTWAKCLEYKDRLLRILSWAGYILVSLFVATQFVLPYLEGHPEHVDALMQHAGSALKTGAYLASDAWSTTTTYLDSAATYWQTSGMERAVMVVVTPGAKQRAN